MPTATASCANNREEKRSPGIGARAVRRTHGPGRLHAYAAESPEAITDGEDGDVIAQYLSVHADGGRRWSDPHPTAFKPSTKAAVFHPDSASTLFTSVIAAPEEKQMVTNNIHCSAFRSDSPSVKPCVEHPRSGSEVERAFHVVTLDVPARDVRGEFV